MALASTIEVNDGSMTPTGIVVVVQPGSDPSVPVELWRAADLAGVPDTANAVMVVGQVLPPGGRNYVDRLPTDGVIWWYRARTNGNAYGPGPYTEWINLGTADRLIPDAVQALDNDSAVKNSVAWQQQVARMGPQVQNILPNPGFEDGLAFWTVNTPVDGTGRTVITNAANAHTGNAYLKLTTTTGVRTNLVAADDAGKKRYFEVNPGDLVQWGGWAWRESGTDTVQFIMQTADKDKVFVANQFTAAQNTAAWVFVEGQYLVPASGVKYVSFFCDSDGTGTATVARFDDVYLRIGIGAISDVPPPNTRYQIRFAAGVANPDTIDGMQSYIDFPATTNFLRFAQVPFAIASSTDATPIAVTTSSSHGYSTGDHVTIRGHLTNVAANGTWTIIKTGTTTFTLTGSVGSGAGAGGATGHVVRLQLTVDGPTGLTSFYGGIESTSVKVRDANAKIVMDVSGTNRIFAIPVTDLGAKSADFNVDLSTGTTQQVQLGASALKLTFLNPVDGGRYRMWFQQDVTGSRTFPTITNAVMYTNDTPPVLTTSPGVLDLYEFEYRENPTARFTCMTLQTNVVPPTPTTVGPTTNGIVSGTNHNVLMPATVTTGQLLLMFFGYTLVAGAITTPTGWTLVTSGDGTAAPSPGLFLFAKISDGTEGGTNVNVVTTNAVAAIGRVYKISSWKGNIATGVAAALTAITNSTTADPPSLTPGWTDRDLWIAYFIAVQDANNPAPPTNYTDDGAGTVGATASDKSGHRTLFAATENPGAFGAFSVARNWRAVTVAIQPPA